MRYISHSNLVELLDSLSVDYQVCVPYKQNDQRYLRPHQKGAPDSIVVGEVRPVEPLKSFYFLSREAVAEDFADAAPEAVPKPLCLVGVKACDLKGFKVQDHVFLGNDFIDPFYAEAREKNLIIAADCTCAIDTCFCLALDVRPYPETGFDLSLAAINGGYVVETGSPKGETLINQHPSLFNEATDEAVAQRDKQRAHVVEAVEKNIQENGVPREEHYAGAVQSQYESPVWADEASTCVECGACNTICPTCHCFLLFDQKDENRMARFRIWDSCLLKGFARVAGGANPRPKLWMRLRNRFEKKFDYFPMVAGVYACTGCGRCISACPAKIDIRRVLKRLASDGQ